MSVSPAPPLKWCSACDLPVLEPHTCPLRPLPDGHPGQARLVRILTSPGLTARAETPTDESEAMVDA